MKYARTDSTYLRETWSTKQLIVGSDVGNIPPELEKMEEGDERSSLSVSVFLAFRKSN